MKLGQIIKKLRSLSTKELTVLWLKFQISLLMLLALTGVLGPRIEGAGPLIDLVVVCGLLLFFLFIFGIGLLMYVREENVLTETLRIFGLRSSPGRKFARVEGVLAMLIALIGFLSLLWGLVF